MGRVWALVHRRYKSHKLLYPLARRAHTQRPTLREATRFVTPQLATATVSTAPAAKCGITVTYKSGPSRAGGLEPKTADDDEQVSWTWMVGTNTTAGEWPIDVTCTSSDGSDSIRTHFEVAR